MACESTSGLFQFGRCCGPTTIEYFKMFSAWTQYYWLDTGTPPDEDQIISVLSNRVQSQNIDDNVSFPKNQHYGVRYLDGSFQSISILCSSIGAAQRIQFPPTSFFARKLIRSFYSPAGTFQNLLYIQIAKATVYDLAYPYCYVNFHGTWPAVVQMLCDFGNVNVPSVIWNGRFNPSSSKFDIPIPSGVDGDDDNNRNQYIGTSPNYPGTSFGGQTCEENPAP